MESALRPHDTSKKQNHLHSKKEIRDRIRAIDSDYTFPVRPNIQRLGISATLEINNYVKNEIRDGRPVVNFGLGQSPFGAPKILEKELARNSHRTSYLPTEGIPELRENISKFYYKYFNIQASPSQIVIGPGSKELIFDIMLALESPWLFVAPSWVSYENQAKILGRQYWKAYSSYKNEYRITEKMLRKRFNEIEDQLDGLPLIMLINYPNNPTGLTLKKSEVQRIARFARNNEIIILSDEIYANVTHPSVGFNHYSFYLENPETTIVTGGISKDRSLGGWRLGVAIIPESQPKLIQALKTIGSESFSSVAAPIQYAAITAYDCNPEVDKHITASTMIHNIVGSVVHKHLVKSGFEVPMPEGAFYLMPSLNHKKKKLNAMDIQTSKDLILTLIREYGIAAVPGTAFGLRADDLAFRMAYIDYDGPYVLEKYREDPDYAINNAEEFVSKYCPNIMLGLEKLDDFMKML